MERKRVVVLTRDRYKISRGEVLNLINEVQKPKQVAIMHCKAHQGGTLKISEGNRLADRADQQIAWKVWNVPSFGTT